MGKNINLGLLVLRLSLGFLMLLHGIAKLKTGISGIENMVEAKGLPGFLGYAVYIGEIVAPILIIIGYRTRIAALILMINCGVAAYLAYNFNIFYLGKNGGWVVELLGLYFLGALVLFLTKGGTYALSSNSSWD